MRKMLLPSLTALLVITGGRVTLAAPLNYAVVEAEAGEEFSVQATLVTPGRWPDGAVAELVFHYQDPRNYLAARITPAGVGFVRVQEGKEWAWGDAGEGPPPAGTAWRLTLQCRPWQIALVANGQVLARAYGPEFPAGQIGTGTNDESLRWEEVQVQRTEPVYFADDFVRAAGQPGAWETWAGKFDIKLPHSPQPNVEQSANPFSYQVQTPDLALTVAGYWFSESYLLSVAVRPAQAGGAVGLAVYGEDANNYLLFRFAGHAAGEAGRQLLEVRDGQRTVLAHAPGGYVSGQWYRLAVRINDGHCTAFIDDIPALTARTNAFGQGRFGLFASQDYFREITR